MNMKKKRQHNTDKKEKEKKRESPHRNVRTLVLQPHLVQKRKKRKQRKKKRTSYTTQLSTFFLTGLCVIE